MYVYEYTDETPRDFPTLGLRGVKKGDIVKSIDELNSDFLKDVKPAKKSSVENVSKGDEN